MGRTTIPVLATVAFAVPLMASLCACGDRSPEGAEPLPPPIAATSPAVPTLLAAGSAAPPGVWRTSIQIHDAPAGAEEHVCQVFALENASPLWVNEVNAHLSPGSHHLIVDRLPTDTPLTAAAYPCDPTGGADVTRLMIAQRSTSSISLPNGVAYRLQGRQHILLQLHYLNSTSAPLSVRADVELREAPGSGAEAPVEARSVFTGTFAIELQPRQVGRAQIDAVIGADARELQRHVFAMTSHMHRLGVRASIYRLDAAGEPSALLHTSDDWAEPPLSVLEPALTLQSREALRLVCEYLNPTDHTVRFGPEADSEMCMLWVHYYDL